MKNYHSQQITIDLPVVESTNNHLELLMKTKSENISEQKRIVDSIEIDYSVVI